MKKPEFKNLTALQKGRLETMFDEDINDNFGMHKICGNYYPSAEIVKNLTPAFYKIKCLRYYNDLKLEDIEDIFIEN